jgi:hypothetical protein
MALAGSGSMRMGADVNVELGSSATTQVSLGQATVRTLIGVASGAVSFPTNFYGKSSGPSNPTTGIYFGGYTSANSNLTTRINACGALIGAQTSVGTAKVGGGGAKAGAVGSGYGVFYGGCNYPSTNSTVTRINSCGTLVGSEGSVGQARKFMGSAPSGCNAMFYAGVSANYGIQYNTITRINSSGTLVGSQTNAGTAGCIANGGAKIGCNALFLKSFLECGLNATRINKCGALVGSVTTLNVGTSRCSMSQGVGGVNNVGLFYGGYVYIPECTFCIFCPIPESFTVYNTVNRVNACGALIGSATSAGTAKISVSAGPQIGANSVFYGGKNGCCVAINTVTRINTCGTLVGSETGVGTARQLMNGGASV